MTNPGQTMPAQLRAYLGERIGQRIFLNADSRHPSILEAVYDDYITLHRTASPDDPEQSFIIPLNSIVSLQEVEGLGGVVVYLVR